MAGVIRSVEKKDDQTRSISLDELKRIDLEVFQVFHDFCVAHNLRYYLAGGSLIGAIRHKGFIPWDDDIDILMPRPDCLKLIELSNNGMLDSYRKLDCVEIDTDCSSNIIRIYDNRTKVVFENYRIQLKVGCWIDIFPMDGLPKNAFKRKLHFNIVRGFLVMYYACITKFGIERRSKLKTVLQYGMLPVLPLIRAVGHKRLLRWLNKLVRRYDFEDCEYVAVVMGSGKEHEMLKRKDMEPATTVEFEGQQFYTMANYETYLRNMYGDYMTPPPEDKRVSRHEIKAYWID